MKRLICILSVLAMIAPDRRGVGYSTSASTPSTPRRRRTVRSVATVVYCWVSRRTPSATSPASCRQRAIRSGERPSLEASGRKG